MRGKRFTEEQIIKVLKEAEAGKPVPELCRIHGISQASTQTKIIPSTGMPQRYHIFEYRDDILVGTSRNPPSGMKMA